MPLPKTTDVGTIMHELKEGRPRPYKQRVAIALSHARKMGANIPKSPISEEVKKRGKRQKNVFRPLT